MPSMTINRSSSASRFLAFAAGLISALALEPNVAFGEVDCSGKTITANVVALDQPFYYNRLGAINANGMIYALARDVFPIPPNGELNETLDGSCAVSECSAGQVYLRSDKRPRPLVLRVNEGQCLEITFTNLLDPDEFVFRLPDEFVDLGGEQIDDQPLTRDASIHVDGLNLVGTMRSDGSNVGENDSTGNGLVAPDDSIIYTYYAEYEGTHLAYSMGSTLGGEGNGGTRAFGLFGAVNVEPYGSDWFRSQLTRQEMDWAIDDSFDAECGAAPDPPLGFTCDGHPVLDYGADYPVGTDKAGLPIIEILNGMEIVHSDINAIIDDHGSADLNNLAYPNRDEPFREFTVVFHDEAFAVQAFPSFYNDPVLGHTLHSVRDSFPINYGSGGIGSEIIANRLGVGPMWDCVDCKYEEFFLTSWTVGDPAMIVDIPANTTTGLNGDLDLGSKATKALFPDDPSNVHHSYLGDRVKFRNLHAGPKEHHIFHLHAHQWLWNPNAADGPPSPGVEQSNYLDGQAIGPGSGYTYEIAYGGSGNRNFTAGDSIFHCHFYPHFAQGMWELWRVHDTFERGTALDGNGRPLVGSRALPDGEIPAGTPIPGLVPMPRIAMAPMPDEIATIVAYDLDGPLVDGTDPNSSQWDLNGNTTADFEEDFPAAGSFPGYPFYIPGLMGHRPPTPPLDMDPDMDGSSEGFDGGLPRHVVTSGPDEFGGPGIAVEQYQTRLDFNKILHEASAVQIPEDGTPAEQQAMDFHDGPGGGDPTYDSFLPDGGSANGASGFEVNGLPAVAGAPYADPCRADGGGPLPDLDEEDGSTVPNRTLKAANIEMDIQLNKVGWHFQQQRFEALWGDVLPTLTGDKAPEPMVMRLNSEDCAEFYHTNLVPNVYQLDDYQVRTPTDVIGQHIHLVKFDVTSADGAANGFNYEDGTLSPDEVRERITAFNDGGGFKDLDGETRDAENDPLVEAEHPFFGDEGPNDQNWLGARTTIQRWYVDPLLERSWDGGVGTTFTHDHYGPSTHQQVGLYSTVLVEPAGSEWYHNETGVELGTRVLEGDHGEDGGPTTWQAIIETEDPENSHREFYFEFADFQHAYKAGGGVLRMRDNDAGQLIPTYDDFENAVNPSFREEPSNLEDLILFPNNCPPGDVPRPCPEAISADDPGTYAVNFRNEPIGLRVFDERRGRQANGDRGDLALAFQSRTDRAIAALNSQPVTSYPPLTFDLQPGDPWTPMMRAYMGDKLRIRVQVGAHEEEHNFNLHGLKWLKEPFVPNSGWKNSEFFGIDEYFNVQVPIVPDAGPGSPNAVDYLYTVGSETEGTWNGVWGLLRTYARQRADLAELPNNEPGSGGGTPSYVNADAFNGVCPADAPVKNFQVTAVRAEDVLGPAGIVYNSRVTELDAAPGGTSGGGPLIDPTAILHVHDDALVRDRRDRITGLEPGTPIEPLILRVNAGDCINLQLTNALPNNVPDMPGFNSLPPIIDKGMTRAGKVTFNFNDLTPSSQIGLHAQLLAYDVRRDDGFVGGSNAGDELVRPGEDETFVWYAGHLTATYTGTPGEYTLEADPVEFGAVGLVPADRIKGSNKGMVGAIIVEPENSCWITDAGTRAQASVWTSVEEPKLSGECVGDESGDYSFRDFVTIMQNDINLRYSDGRCDPEARRSNIDDIACAVPNISAEGPGVPEDPQDSGQKAINYRAEPLWFRLGIAPNTPFGLIHRDTDLKDFIPFVFSNNLDIEDGEGVVGDPQTPIYTAKVGDEVRLRVLMPGGHARGITYTIHGHNWQRAPYLTPGDVASSVIGDNPQSKDFDGTQEGINPSGHWNFVLEEAGGEDGVPGDYLWRDQASFGSYQGLWGILRVEEAE
jgi:hypothetical protein